MREVSYSVESEVRSCSNFFYHHSFSCVIYLPGYEESSSALNDTFFCVCDAVELVDELATELRAEGHRALAYHAGKSGGERDRSQLAWSGGTQAIMVATVSFGMGIDRADVRFVVHWNLPSNIEAYYQGIGRCGRDGKPSIALLYFSQDDASCLEFVIKLEAEKRRCKEMIGHSRNMNNNNSGTQDFVPNFQHDTTTSSRSKNLEKASLEGVRKMINYSTVTGCRRSKILDHFGQTGGGELCNLKLVSRNGTKGCDWCIDNGDVQQRLEDMHQSRMLHGNGNRGRNGEMLLPPQVKDEVDKWEMELLGDSESDGGDHPMDPLGEEDDLKATATADSFIPHYINGLEKRLDRLEELEYLDEVANRGGGGCKDNTETHPPPYHSLEAGGHRHLPPHQKHNNIGWVTSTLIFFYDAPIH